MQRCLTVECHPTLCLGVWPEPPQLITYHFSEGTYSSYNLLTIIQQNSKRSCLQFDVNLHNEHQVICAQIVRCQISSEKNYRQVWRYGRVLNFEMEIV